MLFGIKQFQQGWGGAPESLRLLAKHLQEIDIACDVFDGRGLHRDVGKLDLLPEPGAPVSSFDFGDVAAYHSYWQAGPWQHPYRTWRIVRAMAPGQLFFYMPRGGLADIEFRRFRDLKKFPYYSLIERRILTRADRIVFSSEYERQSSYRARSVRAASIVIPDFFQNADLFTLAEERALRTQSPAREGGQLTVSFLAEIRPLKGLLPLIEGFIRFVRATRLSSRVVLKVAGGLRPGSRSYLASVQDMLRQSSDVRIELMGPLHHADRKTFYAQSDVFVVPSFSESYGLTVLEALSAGCTVIAGPNIGVLEYLPNVSGLTVMPAVNASEITRALHETSSQADFSLSARTKRRESAQLGIDFINRLALDRFGSFLR
ncbi:glycosyltransferase family 4 protein [Sphingomonas tabacisoli]|uniref:Glycosyltransferase family 4 protein n=1 Tax=Sphingomonas tabacisoli TaxID=2249466 RepID=A0ABW4I594_9SPHN